MTFTRAAISFSSNVLASLVIGVDAATSVPSADGAEGRVSVRVAVRAAVVTVEGPGGGDALGFSGSLFSFRGDLVSLVREGKSVILSLTFRRRHYFGSEIAQIRPAGGPRLVFPFHTGLLSTVVDAEV